MGVVVCLPLFGPAGRELEEGVPIRGKQLRDAAEDLQARLNRAADILDKITAEGWTARVAMYDAILSRPGVDTPEEATRQLGALGIGPEELMIVEEVEDEDAGHA